MSHDGELAADDLQAEITRLNKINRALMNRVERGMNVLGADGFALFESAIALENKVRERTAALEDAMRSLEATNRELVRARDAADAANRAKSSFLARMSHEIRTPMNGVVGTAELLARTDVSEQQSTLLERILRSSDTLLSLIDDILDFSRLEAGRLNIEAIDFDLRDAIEDTAEILAGAAQEKGLELILDLPAHMPRTVTGDPVRVRQVLSNLVDNAVKFTAEGDVFIRLRAAEPTAGDRFGFRLEVQDSGLGLDEEERGRLFDAFTQAEDSTTRQYGGSGLGLAIARQLVELMGGRIGIESRLGAGSTFWIELSLPAPDPSDGLTLPQALRDAHVLIVDDHPRAGETLARQLEHLGLHCTTTTSGVQALGVLMKQGMEVDAPQAMIIDQDMPGMSGDALVAAMQTDPSMAVLPAILLCDVAAVDGLGESAQSALMAQLTKPVRLWSLVGRLADTVDSTLPTTDDATPSATPVMDTPSVRVLLVEDNETSRITGHDILSFYGFEVDFAHDGQEAVDALASGAAPYDVVLMDCHMPNMDGLTATRRIREMEAADPTRPPARIVAVTGNALRGERERCLEAGMNDYVTKPFRMEEIRDVVLRWSENGASPTS